MNRRYRIATWTGVIGGLVAVTAFHYLTSPASVGSHNIYRRLYYLPIVLAAFAGGWRGGLAAAAAATAAYLPHAFFMHHHLDPAPSVDKALEMVLYFGVGGLAGALIDRERRARVREADRAMAQMEAEAEAERMRGLIHLSRGLAHEIRNPLGGIQGAIEILADEIPADSPRREMVGVATAETERLNQVLDHFLQFARPAPPDAGTFAVRELEAHVIALLQPEAEAKGQRLELDALASLTAWADPDQITQVLINLTRNAIQAADLPGRIVLSAAAGGGRVRLAVADEGPGIPAALTDSLYDPYVTGREDGTGLGLSISSLLVRQNGGVLAHAQNPPRGTIFSFDLPIRAEASP